MALTKKEAKHIARNFVSTLDDIPEGSYVITGGNSSTQQRLCRVMCKIFSQQKPFLVLTFVMQDDETVKIKNDRRDYISKMLKKQGVEVAARVPPKPVTHPGAVALAKEAVSAGDMPQWFEALVEDTGIFFRDVEADFYIRIRLRDSMKMVPIKIVLSKVEKAAYFRDYYPDEAASIVAIVIESNSSRESVKKMIVHHIKARINNKTFS